MDDYRIDLEDLVANAFITLMRSNKLSEQRFISYYDIDRFGSSIIKALEEQGLHGRLYLGREQTENFLYYHEKYFHEIQKGDWTGIQLKSDITEQDLLEKYVGYLPLKLLLAIRSDTACSVFGVTGMLSKS